MAVVRQLMVRGVADFSGLVKALKKTNASVKVTNINFLSSIKSADKMSIAYNETARATERAGNRMAKSSKKTAGIMGDAFSGVGNLFHKIFAIAGTAALVSFGKESINLASSLTEVQNVVNQAFGEMAASAEDFASKAYLFNMTELTAKETSATYMAMGKAMGLAGDQAARMAINAAALSGDLASLRDESQEISASALQSIWTGETKQLRKYGIALTKTNLQEYALLKGISKTWKEMSQAEKTTLRYAYVLESLAFAQGDAERTAGSWANRIRRIGLELKEVMGLFGQGLINIFYNILDSIDSVIKKLAYFAELFRQVTINLFGDHNDSSTSKEFTEEVEDSVSAVEDLEDAINDVEEAAKKALLPFDQIHKLDDTTGTSSLYGEVDSAISDLALEAGKYYDDVIKNAAPGGLLDEEAKKQIKEDAARIAETIRTMSEKIGTYLEPIHEKWGELKKYLAEKLGVDIETATAMDVLDALVTYSGEKVTEILDLFGIEVDFSNVSFEGIKQKIEDFKKYLEENNANIEHALFLAGASIVGVFAVLVQEAIDVFSPLIPGIKDIIDGVTEVIYGIVEFINGIFSGDLDLAIDGIKNIFHGIVDFVWGIIEEIGGAFLGFLELINPASWMSNIGEFAGKALKIKGVEGSDELIEGWKSVRKNMTVNGAIEEAFGGWNNFDFTKKEAPKMSFLEWLQDHLTGFASGGVIYGDSVVRVGEYAGANMNPEVIAPQSILQETMSESNMGVIDALYVMSSKICKAIEQNRAVVNVGGKQLADDVTRQQNDRAKITGKSILTV